jgi:predicted O-methyltransferase YrrM
MRSLIGFLAWRAGLAPADAWTTAAERDAAARYAAGRRVLAEIGVWQGAVTCRIRAVMASDATLYTIDPYEPGRLGINYQRLIARGEVARIANGRVLWLRETGIAAAANPLVAAAGPFDFVFVDADHHPSALAALWDAWSPRVAPGGVFAMHEPGRPGVPDMHEGGIRFSDRAAADPRFLRVEVVDSLSFFVRRDD